MLEGFSGASRIPELRRRLMFTALMLAVYRIGVAVPTPGIDGQALASLFDAAPGTLFGWVNMFSGGALERFSIFALGIMPYISVAIILDLLKVAWPYLDELVQRRRGGTAQDYADDALLHGAALGGAGLDDRLRPRAFVRLRELRWSIRPG